MLKVALDHIVPVNEARNRLNELVEQAHGDQLWVLTTNDQPRVAVVDVAFLEQLMRRAWFNDLTARSQAVFDDYLRRRDKNPAHLSDEDMETLLKTD